MIPSRTVCATLCLGVFASFIAHCGSSTTTNDAGTDASMVSDTGTDASSMDVSTDVAMEANPCASAPTLTYYVNTSTGDDTNSGAGPTCAFKTITAALTASAGATHDNATINVAAGTYGAGETFPLIVNHGRSLVGAGASTTSIQGSSSTYTTTGTGSFLDTGTHFLTLLVGDVLGGSNSLGATTISGVTVLPATSITTPTTNYLGMVCLAGNAPNTGAVLPLPTPSLIMSGVTVGPNFDTGVTLAYETTPAAACNAVITGSTMTGSNTGLITGGCGGATNPSTSWSSAQVGDGTSANANTFAASVVDVLGSGCGSIQSINTNHFASGYRGIVLISNAGQYFEILGNTFTGSTVALPMGIGINTNAAAVISKLNGNTFSSISETAVADTAVGATTGYAIAFGGTSILQAHANVISDNDNGILLSAAPANTFDFSADGVTADANQIFCNSKPPSPPVGIANGYDVVLSYTSGLAANANFAGNVWDDSVPTTSVSLTASTNGTDIVTGTSLGATTTGGSATGSSCTGGRVHQ